MLQYCAAHPRSFSGLCIEVFRYCSKWQTLSNPVERQSRRGRQQARRTVARDVRAELDAIAGDFEPAAHRAAACQRALMNPDAKLLALIASLTQQHRSFSETEIENVDKEIMKRGHHDPSAGDQKPSS